MAPTRKQEHKKQLRLLSSSNNGKLQHTKYASAWALISILLTAGRVTKRTKQRMMSRKGERKNLLMALPAELRNDIFERVLVTNDEAVVVGSIKKYSRHGIIRLMGARHCDAPRIRSWREPGLLRTSKAIRKELSIMYYVGNDFIMRTKLEDFQRMSAWLEQLVDRCGPKLFNTGLISVISAIWPEACRITSLAGVFYKTGLQIDPRPVRRRAADEVRSLIHLARDHSRRIEECLEQGVALGQKASEEVWSKETVDREIKKWLKKVSAQDGVRSRIMKAKNGHRFGWDIRKSKPWT